MRIDPAQVTAVPYSGVAPAPAALAEVFPNSPTGRRLDSDGERTDIEPWAIVATVGVIVVGLWVDVALPRWGQTLASVAAWGLLLYFLAVVSRRRREELVVCLLLATVGELFLSLVWGLYEYRLHALPVFVPPGHVLLFLLGSWLSARIPGSFPWWVGAGATVLVVALAVAGLDTMGPVMLAVFLASIVREPARKLCATMFVLALIMELYGTWLGNWVWRETVPGMGLRSANPPLTAGAWYCGLDWLVTHLMEVRSAITRRAREPRGLLHVGPGSKHPT